MRTTPIIGALAAAIISPTLLLGPAVHAEARFPMPLPPAHVHAATPALLPLAEGEVVEEIVVTALRPMASGEVIEEVIVTAPRPKRSLDARLRADLEEVKRQMALTRR